MAINENQENLEQEPQEVVEKVAESPKPQPKAPEKTKFQFPHQLLMAKHNLTVKGLSEKTKEYLGDFEDFMKHVKMAKTSAEKKGNEYVLPEAKKNKLIRLSKSVCTCINDIIDAKEEEQNRKTEERLLFRQKRREMMNKTQEERRKAKEEERRKAKEEEEKRKKEEEEDDTYGFFF